MVKEMVREFAEKEINSIASDIDDKAWISKDVIEKMGALGLCGMLTPQSFNGVDVGFSSFITGIEEISRYSASIACLLMVQNALACSLINNFGSDVQKESFLSDLATGKRIGSVSLGDNGSLLDLADLKTDASEEENGYVIRGSKSAVVNAAYADIFIVLCRFRDKMGFTILDGQDKDLVRSSKKRFLGLRGSGISPIRFYGCRVPRESLLGTLDDTPNIIRMARENLWLGLSSISNGIAIASLDSATRYANERIQFGRPIGRFEAIQGAIADMAIDIDASSVLLERTAMTKNKADGTIRAAMVKVLTSIIAERSAKSALKIHGGYGFIKDYPVERYVRDAETVKVLGDRNDDLRRMVADSLLGYE